MILSDGFIIRMNLKQFFNKFKDIENIDSYLIAIASNNIKHDNEYGERFKQCLPVPSLVPARHIKQIYTNENNFQVYEEKYKAYLGTPKPASVILTLIRAVLEKNAKIILLCDKSEHEYRYLNILGDFIYDTFKLKIYSIKQFNNLEEEVTINNKSEILEVVRKVDKFLSDVRKKEIEREFQTKKNLKSRLEEYDKLTLHAYCREEGLKVNMDMKRKKLIKKLINYKIKKDQFYEYYEE